MLLGLGGGNILILEWMGLAGPGGSCGHRDGNGHVLQWGEVCVVAVPRDCPAGCPCSANGHTGLSHPRQGSWWVMLGCTRPWPCLQWHISSLA